MGKIRVLFVFLLLLLVFQGASTTQAQIPDPVPLADLSVAKADSPDPVIAGETLTYDIEVENRGPADAGGVVLRDDLPRGVRLVSVEPGDRCIRNADDAVARDGADILCKLGDLANGSSTRVVIQVVPLEPGTITNRVWVEAEGSRDPNGDNNRDEESTRVIGRGADLEVAKTDSPDPVFVGEPLKYGIQVKNNGPFDARGVFLTDRLPESVRFVSVAPEDRCEHSEGVVRCKLGDIAHSSSTRVMIEVIPTKAGTITNVAAVEAEEPPDPHIDNNKAAEDTRVVGPEADLAAKKSDSHDPAFVGEPLDYTVDVINNGPDRALGVHLIDELPESVEFVRASPFCEYDEEHHAVACKLGDLDAGSMASSTAIRVIPRKPGIIVNEAVAKAEEPSDPDHTNNSAAERTVVNPADLMVVKEDVEDPVFVGHRLVYHLKVTNRGPAMATEVMLSDRLPPGVRFVSADSSQGRCDRPVDIIDPAKIDPAHMVRCRLGELAPGDSAMVEIVVVPERPGTVVNTANVSGNEPDPNAENNADREETEVLPSEETCFGMRPTIVGTPGNDILIGTREADVIVGLGGNDIIVAKHDDDRICAGPGNDIVIAGAGDDHVSGGDGNDMIVGVTGDDHLLGEAGNDLILGLPGDDDIDCGPGEDVGLGGPGSDTVVNCESGGER